MNKYIKAGEKFLTNKNYRTLLLSQHGVYNHMDDETYLKMIYKARLGKELNLDNPQTFNEKLQWLKLHDRNPLYTTMVDKCEVKKYVANIIGEEHIIPTLGVWNSFDEIDFDFLPNQFVLKCTHDSGGLVICRDKSKLDLNAVRKKLNYFMKRNYYLHNREWPYKNVKHRIIAEQYMEEEDFSSEQKCGLTDYKFYCFNGKPEYLYVSNGLENHKTAHISFLTLDWKFAEFGRSDFKPFETLPNKPEHLKEMITLSEKLAQMVKPFIRVDMYEINQRIYFSELTFSPCAGMMPFQPEEWDIRLGSMITLN